MVYYTRRPGPAAAAEPLSRCIAAGDASAPAASSAERRHERLAALPRRSFCLCPQAHQAFLPLSTKDKARDSFPLSMVGAAFLVARAITAWRSIWSLTPSELSRLRPLPPFFAALEADAARNAELRRRAMQDYARAHIYPRVALGPGLLPRLLPRAEGEEVPHGLSPFNKHALALILSTLPLLLGAALLHSVDDSEAAIRGLPSRSSGFALNARLQALEGRGGGGGAGAPPPPQLQLQALEALEARLAALEAALPAAAAAARLPPPTAGAAAETAEAAAGAAT